ncbi:hypothetical protein [uncultured Microbulbifer sp.]|uniref:hypothetical protein n=1 Tax=uncultured Microbulbifer sp. TaxID=348147 RepID=UPI002618DEEF|nr:hypothetical protein [uncultured Microbulbifer sp.]
MDADDSVQGEAVAFLPTWQYCPKIKILRNPSMLFGVSSCAIPETATEPMA